MLIMFEDMPSYSPERLGFTELSTCVSAAEALHIRLTGDTEAIIGSLGLEGAFTRVENGVLQTSDADTDVWHGDYSENGQVMPMHIYARSPGNLATRITQFFGWEANGEVGGRMFWSDKRPADTY